MDKEIIKKSQKEIWEAFSKDCKNKISKQSLVTYQNAYKAFLLWMEAHNIENPNENDIIIYRKSLEDRLQPNTIQLYIVALKLFYKWTALNGLYPNIAKNLKSMRLTRTHKRNFFSEENAQHILESITATKQPSATDYRDYTLIALMMVCGLKDIEIVRLNWGDLQLYNNKFALNLRKNNNKTEFVVVPEQLQNILLDYKSTLIKQGDNDAIFTSFSTRNTYGRLTTRSVSRICKKRFVNAGFDSTKLTANSLRHTSITLALKSGISLEQVQQHARHKNIATTILYADALKAVENKSSKAAADLIFSKNYNKTITA